jgi:hypothetical protein
MRGPGGWQFGSVITLKLKVIIPADVQDEVQVYKIAMKLAEQGFGTFDDCVEAVKSVKDTGYDEQAAMKVLNATRKKN